MKHYVKMFNLLFYSWGNWGSAKMGLYPKLHNKVVEAIVRKASIITFFALTVSEIFDLS